jgi:hypothetical protein
MEYSRSLSTFVKSKLFAGIITGVAITFVVIFIFEAGVAIGYHEATFSSHWGENYSTNFGGTDYGLDSHQPTAHGSIGKILSVSTLGTTTTLIVDGSSHPEQKVLVNADTMIRSQENTITASALTTGTYVVILGTPNNQGVIEANLIRIVPSPTAVPTTADSTSSPYAAP